MSAQARAGAPAVSGWHAALARRRKPGVVQKTVYYYYMVFAKALQAVGETEIVDAKGQRHNWREDLGRKLLMLQHPEGYWVNTEKAELQDNKVLVTAFTMLAIESALQ